MASDSLSDCLKAAVKELNKIQDLDAEEQAKILQRLESVAIKQRATPEDRIIAVEQAIRNSRRDILGAQVAFKRNEEVVQDLLTDPRFREESGETFEDVAAKAENHKRFASPAAGGRGDATEATLVSKMRFEFRALGARFNDILNFVTDNRFGAVDSESARLFYMEMVGLDSGSARARQLMQQFRESVSPYITRLRAAGVHVDVIKDFFPQSHDMPKIARDRKGWKEFLRNNLDPDQHPDPETTADALWNRLVDRDITEQTGGGVGMQRKIKFKDGEAELEYYYRFGNGTVARDMTGLIHKLSHATVLAEQYGPRPMQAIEAVRKNIATRAENLKPGTREAKRLDRRMDIATDIVRFLSQPPTLPKYQGIENWAAATRLGFGALKLGKVALQQIPEDFILGTVFGRSAAGGYWKSFTSRTTRLAELLDANGDLRKFAEAWGVWQNTNLMLTASRTMTAADNAASGVTRAVGEGARETAARGLGLTQRWTGAMWLENFQRSASFMVLHDGVARMRGQGWGDLNPQFRRNVLEANGMTKRDWESLRKTETGEFGILNLTELEKRNPALFRKYMAMAVNEAETQTNFPDIESLLWAQGVRTDRYSPQARRFITQFWGWGLSIQRRAVMREFQSGVVPTALAGGATLATAAAGLQLYALAAGDPPYQWDSPQLWQRSVMRSAAVGPVVPTAADMFLGGPFASVPGAVPSTLTRMGSGVVRGGKDALTGDIEAASVEGIKIADTLAPNWWMTDAMLSKSMDAMIFELDPQELRKRNRRFREEQRVGN